MLNASTYPRKNDIITFERINFPRVFFLHKCRKADSLCMQNTTMSQSALTCLVKPLVVLLWALLRFAFIIRSSGLSQRCYFILQEL